MTTKLSSGDIVFYPYLWRREADRGETEGRKARPACVAIMMEMKGKSFIYFLAITIKNPQSGQVALEIPVLEKRRAGLDTGKSAWIITSEYNRDILGESFYLSPTEQPTGRFSERFLRLIQRSFRECIRNSNALVNRQG